MSDVYMVTAFVGLAAAVLAPRKNLRTGRRVFWGGTLIACVSVFLMAYPPDWKSGIGMSLLVACAMAFIAYANTPFLRIRGRVYAFSNDDRRADQPVAGRSLEEGAPRPVSEPYGAGVTAAKSWWRAVLVMAIFAFSLLMFFTRNESPWLAALTGIGVMLGAVGFGYRDALLGNSIASGQHVQFVIISVLTVGVFAVLYLSTYYVAKRWTSAAEDNNHHQQGS